MFTAPVYNGWSGELSLNCLQNKFTKLLIILSFQIRQILIFGVVAVEWLQM